LGDHVQLCDHVIEQLGHGIKKTLSQKLQLQQLGHCGISSRILTATFIPQLAAMFFWKE
jgi:hypothetical protein